MATWKITQVKSRIGCKQNQRETVRTLGLKLKKWKEELLVPAEL